jgi:uncharacterized protein YndB with AHSA1/START domain
MWTHQASIHVAATPAQLWRLFAEVDGWPRWNNGIARIALHGAFAAGTTFTMQPPGEDAFTSTLRAVVPDTGFTDETMIGDTCVVVHHELHPLPDGGTRVTYRTEITGPDAAGFGPMVTADFPEVLASLKRIAEGMTQVA